MHLCSFVHLCVGVLTAAVWVCGSWGRPVHMWAVGAVSYGLVKICLNKKNKCSDRSWLMLNGKTAIIHCRFINIMYLMTLYIHREMCCCDAKLPWEDHCYSWKPWAGFLRKKAELWDKSSTHLWPDQPKLGHLMFTDLTQKIYSSRMKCKKTNRKQVDWAGMTFQWAKSGSCQVAII